jgi:hypothetical protein
MLKLVVGFKRLKCKCSKTGEVKESWRTVHTEVFILLELRQT